MDNVTLIRIVSGFLALSVFLLPLYFLPVFLARKKRQFLSILLLDIFLGWTVLGWIGALIWAISDQPTEAPTATLCSNCGRSVPPLSQFCSGCGHSLSPNVLVAR